MKLIPLLKVRNITEAVAFYTTVLDFELKGTIDNEYGVEKNFTSSSTHVFQRQIKRKNLMLMVTEQNKLKKSHQATLAKIFIQYDLQILIISLP